MNVTNTAAGVSAIITSRVAGVRTASGFQTDIGARVFRGRRKITDEMVATGCVSIIEGLDTVQDQPGRVPSALIGQTYALVAYVPFGDEEPNDAALRAIADLKRTIFKGDTTFGGQVKKVEYLGRDIGTREDGANIVMALIEIRVSYVEDLTNP